jgi:hypothetical protein
MDSNKIFTHERLTKFVDDYKDYIQDKKKEQGENPNGNFDYYHFDLNPNGIITSLMGRYSHEILSGASTWSPMAFKNGIDGWKMTLARGLSKYKRKEQEKFHSNANNGLNFIINYDELPVGVYYGPVNINIDQDYYTLKVATEYNDRGTDNSVLGISSDLTTLKTGTNDLLYNQKGNMAYKLVTVNWYGLFYGEIGSYKITCTGENCTFYVWFGDEAICEYTHYNCIVNNNKTESDDLFFSYNKYVPIRIQCYYYGNVQSTVDFEVNVQKLTTGQDQRSYSDVALHKVFFHSPTPPLVLYHAYVSSNEQDFTNDEFQCISLVDIKDDELYVKDYGNLLIFYSRFRQFLSNSFNNEYDYNNENRLSYGVIPDINIQYTIQGMEGYPFAYSIYKINSDARMGKTYQINTKLNDNISYPMKEMKVTNENSMLAYSDVYSTYQGFYPNKDSLDIRFYNEAIDADPLQCKEQCNKNPSCGHYFTYKSLGNDKCVINSNTKEPSFNRVPPKNTHRPIDENSSSLYMRNYQLNVTPEQRDCIKIGSTSNESIVVKNTSNYSDTFEYSSYNLDKKPIQSIEEMGICGDEKYIQFKNDSADLLFKDTTYYKDGTWIENFETKEPVSKYTDVISDTGDAVRTNLSNERVYEKKAKAMNKNFHKLRNKDIPDYLATKEILKSNKKYDYDGDDLYFRKKRLPHLMEKKIMDHNQLYLNTKLLYTLGTVTCATLIVLAIILARE